MPADAKPEFEVSTIKPSKTEERFSLLVNRSGMLNTTSTSLSDLIKFAYDVHPKQIGGGPAWLESDKFDVTGKPDTAGMPSINQLKVMVQKLLADRFALKFHREPKELSVYAITIAKGGPKLTKEESNPTGLPQQRNRYSADVSHLYWSSPPVWQRKSLVCRATPSLITTALPRVAP
jgi:uncharacterized protein (TIGR03435 family)